MVKQRAALLKNADEKDIYTIKLKLQGGHWATFEYSDRFLAREHYDILTAQGVLATVAIKDAVFETTKRSQT
jgi:hypothetical protein